MCPLKLLDSFLGKSASSKLGGRQSLQSLFFPGQCHRRGRKLASMCLDRCLRERVAEDPPFLMDDECFVLFFSESVANLVL